MELRDKVIVITGAARGIGAALSRHAAQQGARAIVVSDVDVDQASVVAAELDGLAMRCDVAVESDVNNLVTTTLQHFGRIDVFVSNAGITVKGGLDTPLDQWQRMWDVNVKSRLFAARAVVPHMLEQGDGYLVHTASAAGVLTEIGSASYSVTKHADVALGEWLAICYGRRGIRVSCVCPLGVETDMIDNTDPIHRYLHLHAISADEAANAIVKGIQAETFLILPHPEVKEFFALKTDDYDRWIRGMQRLQQKLTRSAERRAA